jgi:hypothetical protein
MELGPSRRDVVRGLAVLGASARFRGSNLSAQAVPNTRRLDLHHHFGTPAWIQMVNAKKTAGYQTWQPYTPAKSIEDMDRGGVAASMISVTTPGIWFGDKEETRRLARELNEYGAKMVSDYKARFGRFAVLPLPDVDASFARSNTRSTPSRPTVLGYYRASATGGTATRNSRRFSPS